MEEDVAIARQLMVGLLERMGLKAEVQAFIKEGDFYLDISGDREEVLIGRHGRTLDSLQILINRMVNKQIKRPVKVILDVDRYRKRRADNLTEMAKRLGEKVKRTGYAMTVGPFNAHDRRIIHVSLQEESELKTESIGDGEIKKVKIVPNR